MTKTLIEDCWVDVPLSILAINEEISTIDRVINKRISSAIRVMSRGVTVNMSTIVDDLLTRRRRLTDLAHCLYLEETFTPGERRWFGHWTAALSKKSCDRFPG